MSGSNAIEDTNQRRNTTLSSAVSADGCGDSYAAWLSAGSILKSSAISDTPSKSITDTVGVVNDAPDALSSDRPSMPLYNPLLALAMVVDKETPIRETNQISSPEDKCQKSRFRTDKKTAASGFHKSESMVDERTADFQKPKIESIKVFVDPSLHNSKDRDDSILRRNCRPDLSTPIKDAYSANRTQTRKSFPPIKKRDVYKHKLAGESKKEPQTLTADGASPYSERMIEATWNLNYQTLVEYHAIHGDSNVLRSDPNKQLSGWVKRQRNNLKDGKLTLCKIVRLNNLDFVWNRSDARWHKKYCDLVRFQTIFGHCYVTVKYDRTLAEWTQRQRREYKNGMKGWGKLANERVKKLEAIQGWSWDKLGRHLKTTTSEINYWDKLGKLSKDGAGSSWIKKK